MPETQQTDPATERPHPVIDADLCKGCGRCVAACPSKVLHLREKLNRRGVCPAEYVGEGCTGCAICHYNCPEIYAIQVRAPRRPKRMPAPPQPAPVSDEEKPG